MVASLPLVKGVNPFLDRDWKGKVIQMDHKFPPPELQLASIAREIYVSLGKPHLKEEDFQESSLWDQVLDEVGTLDANSLMLAICMTDGRQLLNDFPDLPISEDETGERLIERLATTAIVAKILEIYG